MPRRMDVDDFMAQLSAIRRPHLAELRALSLAAAPAAVEELKWNQPCYVLDGNRLWLLQSFQEHCSLRFPIRFFTRYRDEVVAAGYQGIEGAIKVRYDQPVPAELVARLMAARVAEHLATGAKWDDD